jgi:hypothetical protein
MAKKMYCEIQYIQNYLFSQRKRMIKRFARELQLN